jgi:hypothetical protein
MFISKKLVYLQMQKTGSTHVTKVLQQFVGGRRGLRHGQMTDPEKYRKRFIFSSVRNPWDWYVSLYAFGCAGSGGFRKYLVQMPMSEIRHAWAEHDRDLTRAVLRRTIGNPLRGLKFRRLYKDAHNTENFRIWLKLVLGEEGQHILKEGYGTSEIRKSVGFMTYRFLALTTDYNAWMAEGRSAATLDQVRAFADKHNIAKRVLRMETLNEELLDVMTSAGTQISMEQIEEIGKTNASEHRKYTDYYDDETYRLVAERDRFIVDRFGYQRF